MHWLEMHVSTPRIDCILKQKKTQQMEIFIHQTMVAKTTERNSTTRKPQLEKSPKSKESSMA